MNIARPAPVLSVVLPVRNGETFLKAALDSIRAQTFSEFELIVVDDGSTDGTSEILAATNDPRLRIIRNTTRRGIAGSLNRGFESCRGRYVARMDADDISLPTRFARQVRFLEAHGEVGMCGTWVRMFSGRWSRDRRLESDPERMRCSLLMFNVLSHPSVMLRRELFTRHGLAYDESFENSEDYEMWTRASLLFPPGNLREVLLLYRVHPEQAGRRVRAVRLQEGERIRRAHLDRLGVRLSLEEEALHHAVSMGEAPAMGNWLGTAAGWLEKILDANARHHLFAASTLRRVLLDQLLLTYARDVRFRPQAYGPFLRLPLRGALGPRAMLSLIRRAVSGALDDRRFVVNSPPANSP
ncbi:MAG TPA: glycosyltransferase [Blastocatellia bacterium]|nr:glycosyltransferase [Blastocatellia bacterium]